MKDSIGKNEPVQQDEDRIAERRYPFWAPALVCVRPAWRDDLEVQVLHRLVRDNCWETGDRRTSETYPNSCLKAVCSHVHD